MSLFKKREEETDEVMVQKLIIKLYSATNELEKRYVLLSKEQEDYMFEDYVHQLEKVTEIFNKIITTNAVIPYIKHVDGKVIVRDDTKIIEAYRKIESTIKKIKKVYAEQSIMLTYEKCINNLINIAKEWLEIKPTITKTNRF